MGKTVDLEKVAELLGISLDDVREVVSRSSENKEGVGNKILNWRNDFKD